MGVIPRPACAARGVAIGCKNRYGSSRERTEEASVATASSVSKNDNEELCDLIVRAFNKAYPDVEESRIEHMARNFVQVVGGVIDIGERMPCGEVDQISHMDIANSMVFWCIMNTRLEEFIESDGGKCDSASPLIPAADAELLRKEFAARIADWLAGIEALKSDPVMYEAFIRGTLAMGTAHWQRDRDDLGF